MFLTTTRRPFEGFQNLRRLNNVLDEAFGNWPFQQDESGSITSAWHPACDVFEDKDTVKIVAELPGVKPEDVKLSLENNLLTIRGEKKQEAEERTERVHRYERSYGTFERAFVAAQHRGRREDLGGVQGRGPHRHRAQGRAGPAPGDPGPRRLSRSRARSVVLRSPLRSFADCPPGRSAANLSAMLRDLLVPCRWHKPSYGRDRAPRAVRVHPGRSRGLAPGSGRRRQHRAPALHLQSLRDLLDRRPRSRGLVPGLLAEPGRQRRRRAAPARRRRGRPPPVPGHRRTRLPDPGRDRDAGPGAASL